MNENIQQSTKSYWPAELTSILFNCILDLLSISILGIE